ncbi:MAG TPA: gluconate 2-dehydrogenase subunit 3 family protein [Albitalea sp.]|nr:gluconate 2-dehydrogenase subunit 3 family protein [Albitalea sp.]
MSSHPGDVEAPRRRFIKNVAGVAAIIPIHALAAGPVAGASAAPAAAPSPSPASVVPDGYQFFSTDEAAFVESLVTTMCPADALTPDGVACGLATFMDRQLAGSFGSGERVYRDGPWQPGKPEQGYQLPFDPAGFFRAGLAAVQVACQAANGKKLEQLAPAQREAFLTALAQGQVPGDRVALAPWFNELVYPLFEQACFADPVYGGNREKVFWRMVGYPGLPAFHSVDVRSFRGKPFPAAKQPRSIQDFS